MQEKNKCHSDVLPEKQLQAWVAGTRGVKRILGLERLLEGRHPEVSAFLLMIPVCLTRPESIVESVALLVVVDRTNTEALTASLCHLVDRSKIPCVTS
jgi:hypothetical protein